MPAYDVCLVSMPFPSLSQPSIALGLLKAALARVGISVRVFYPCVAFAEEIGLDVYMAIYGSKQEFLVGEWIFSEAAFPEHDAPVEEYLDRVLSAPVSHGLLRRSRFVDDPRAALLETRRAASGFVARMTRELLQYSPKIVGCTSTFAQHCASLALLRSIKTAAPEVVTLLGGANCEAAMGVATVQSFPWVDFLVSGEADLLIPELCSRVLANGTRASVQDLHGVLHGRHSSVVFGTPAPRASVSQLDALPTPDFEEFFATLSASSLRDFIAPGLALETSRGCWWGQKHHCKFCGLNGSNMEFRSKSAARVASELEELSGRHSLRNFNIVDNILDMRYIEELLPNLPSAQPYQLFYETKSNLRRDQLSKLANAGIRTLQPGIESMHDEILRLIDKGTTALQNVQLLKWARELGVFIAWNLLWDVPGEKDEWYSEMAEWLPWISHLQPPGVDRIQFHRFSPYHRQSADHGLTLRPFSSYAHVYGLDEQRLDRLAYYFDEPTRATTEQALERRPGLKRALIVVGRWQLRWGMVNSDSPPKVPLLLMREEGEAIHVEDTRPAGGGEQVIEGFAARVYRCCDKIGSLASVTAAVRAGDAGTSERAVGDAIDELERRKLVLRINSKILGLALRTVSPILDRAENAPGGNVDVDKWRAAVAG
jgi:magnesium-protoporphyrin IX monomethyl ester (oxidative) cyclase